MDIVYISLDAIINEFHVCRSKYGSIYSNQITVGRIFSIVLTLTLTLTKVFVFVSELETAGTTGTAIAKEFPIEESIDDKDEDDEFRDVCNEDINEDEDVVDGDDDDDDDADDADDADDDDDTDEEMIPS